MRIWGEPLGMYKGSAPHVIPKIHHLHAIKLIYATSSDCYRETHRSTSGHYLTVTTLE